MNTTLEQTTMRKVAIRLVPFLCVLYTIAFIDRINVGFAALSMSADLGLSPAAFGLGAGLFFIGYFLFEVPSNLILERVGARRLDRPGHDHLGHPVRVLRLRSRPEQLLCPALPARRGRGRLLPRRDPLPDLLVPEALSRPRHRRAS